MKPAQHRMFVSYWGLPTGRPLTFWATRSQSIPYLFLLKSGGGSTVLRNAGSPLKGGVSLEVRRYAYELTALGRRVRAGGSSPSAQHLQALQVPDSSLRT